MPAGSGSIGVIWSFRLSAGLPWAAAAVVGGILFASAPIAFLTRLLGIFLLASVAYRHLTRGRGLRLPLRGFAMVGAALSFLSALLGSIGPMMTPFFLAYGLMKGAFIGTEALSTVIMHITKIAVYGKMAVLTWENAVIGLFLGPAMILGSFVGKRILDRLPERLFLLLIEGFLIVVGLGFLIRG